MRVCVAQAAVALSTLACTEPAAHKAKLPSPRRHPFTTFPLSLPSSTTMRSCGARDREHVLSPAVRQHRSSQQAATNDPDPAAAVPRSV
eukprot:6180838-Pleurochrysis_carterae.AAC.1